MTQRSLRFYAENFAPWCEKARWALDHHGIAYRYREHVPLIGELSLRLALRGRRGKVTVPLLTGGGLTIMDSFEIAHHAERGGRGPALFPAGHESEVTRCNARSDVLMVAGRALLLPRMLANREALREQLPPRIPVVLRPSLSGVAAFGVRFLMRKYGVRARTHQLHESTSRQVLGETRGALARGGTHLLGDAFSFADIAMATALQFVRPVADEYIALGPATREAWTHAELAADYADLLAWRDRLYAEHRKRCPAGVS